MCLTPAAAAADDISSAELVQLAQRAPDDPAARARLARIDRVDGRPAAVGTALRGARGPVLAERAGLLAEGVQAGAIAPAGDSRAQAGKILDERRFRGSSVPRPFAGAIGWLGDRLQPVADFFGDLGARIPGGGPVLYGIVAALVVLAAAALSRRTIRRRAAAAARSARAEEAAREDPRELERAADRADAAGEWERAVRLRFRAGLLRLDARDVLEYRPSLTTGEVAATVGSPAFYRVGSDFDAIAYGGREAHEQDARASREGWQRVLAEVGGG